MSSNVLKKIIKLSMLSFVSFVFTACGGSSTSGEKSPNTLLGENHKPIAFDANYTIFTNLNEKKSLNILLGAEDQDGDQLKYVLLSQPSHGTLIGSAPKLIYSPQANYRGEDSFVFKVNDGKVDSLEATIHIDIQPQSVSPATAESPIALDDSASTKNNTSVIIDILANDHDPDGTLDPATITITTPPIHGTATITDGKVLYVPNKDYNGNDSFKYTVKDNEGALSNEATVAILVSNTNDVPTANPQNPKTKEDQPVDITLSGSDPDGDTISYIIVSQPTHGTISGTAPNITYTPQANYHGADSFTFKVNDGKADSSVATVSIDIESINDAPSANDDSVSTKEDTNTTIDILANDHDPDGTLDPATITITTPPTHGTATITDGKVLYVPNKDYNGNDSFKYTVKDNEGALSNEAGVAISIESVNDVPIARDDNASTTEGISIAIEPLINDEDPDGNNSSLSIVSASDPQHGTILIQGKNIYYAPHSSDAQLDSFAYTIRDEGGAEANATITVHIVLLNEAPIAYGQTLHTQEDKSISFKLNASDPDGDDINYTIVYQPQHGSLAGAAPHLIYTPAHDFSGTDYIPFKVSDGMLESYVAVVTIVVDPINDPPVADAGADYTGIRGDRVTFDASGSYDVDGEIVSYLWREGNTTLSHEKSFDHQMMTEGVHTITLTVTDDQNATDSDEKIVTINPCCDGCNYPDPTATNPFN